MAKYASLIVWVDWEDHSTLLYRSWFDHFARWNSPTYFCPTAEISQSKFHLPPQFLHPCKFYSSKSISSPHLTQSNSFREPKRFASFYRCCRYYSLLQKEQSMGKKQQESDKFLYYSSLSESTVESSIRPWIPCTPINVLEGEGGGEEENPVHPIQQDKQKVPATSYLTPSPR